MEPIKPMKQLLILEECILFAASILLFSNATSYSWWFFALLFFLPDISFAGYLVNPKTGAWIYNLFHHKGVMTGLIMTGYLGDYALIMAIGIIFFAHACFDRIFGFGLKYSDSFHHTHLGRIG